MANQIQKKYIKDGAVDGDKIKLLEGQSIVQESSGGDVELIKLDSNGDVIVSGKEVAFKEQVDAEASARQAADASIESSIDNLSASSDVLFEDNAAVYADATAPVASPKGHDGWYYISAGSSDKINWYFFSVDSATVTVDNFTRMYTVGQVDSTNGDTFHLAYYTVAQGDGNDAGSWYRSRQVFVPNGSFSRGKKCLFYVGSAPSADVYPDLERVEMTLSTISSVGPNDGSEVILTTVIGTNSAASAGTVEILMNRLGFNSSSYDKEYSLEIRDQFNLSGIKQSILEEIGRRQKEDSLLESSLNTEISDRQSADSTLQSNIDSEESSRIAADSTLQSNIDSEESSRIAADNTLQSNIDAEESARISGDSNLQGQIDTEKGRIDAILLSADADKDSFAEIVSLINSVDTENDNAFAAYVLSNDAALAQEVSDRQSGDSTLQSNIDSEESARIAADSSLQSEIDAVEARLDTLETGSYKKEKFTLTSTDISNGYVDLGFQALENSIRGFVGRLAIHEGAGEDYTVSVVGGVTRLTFVGNMVTPSDEQLVAGDVLYFSYQA